LYVDNIAVKVTVIPYSIRAQVFGADPDPSAISPQVTDRSHKLGGRLHYFRPGTRGYLPSRRA